MLSSFEVLVMDIIFVILNYNQSMETVKCIRSIRKKIDTKKYGIIVVDNGSNKEEVQKLHWRFDSANDVSLICLDKNIGFARGNNVGINRACEIGAKYICCLNDDTQIISKNLFSILEDRYSKYKSAVIGPAIIQHNGKICRFNHPFHSLEKYKDYLKEIESAHYQSSQINRMKYWVIDNLRILLFFYCIINYVYEKVRWKEKEIIDIVLQGSCLIFTPAFFKHLKGFNQRTFLYYEEEFLSADLKIHKIHSLYCPDIQIYHKGGTATKSLSGKEEKRHWEFSHANLLKSCRSFVSYLEDNIEDIYSVEI